MGYTSYNTNGRTVKECIIDEINDTSETRSYKVIASSQRGGFAGIVYLAVEEKINGETSTVGYVAKFSYRSGEISTKIMTEMEYPYYFDCPERILKLLSPTDNENALEWRGQCRKVNKTTNKIKYNQKFEFKNPLKFSDGQMRSRFKKIRFYGMKNYYECLDTGRVVNIKNVNKRETRLLS